MKYSKDCYWIQRPDKKIMIIPGYKLLDTLSGQWSEKARAFKRRLRKSK